MTIFRFKENLFGIKNGRGVDIPVYFSTEARAGHALQAIPPEMRASAEKARGCFQMPEEIAPLVAPFSDITFTTALNLLHPPERANRTFHD